MGNTESKPPPPAPAQPIPAPPQPAPPPPKLYENPWRKVDKTYPDLVEEITQINPKCAANVLLLGPAGAGKSSTINSFLSIAEDRRVNMAYTGSKDTSFTTSYGKFTNTGFLKNCCFWDSMGIEQVLDGGLILKDLIYLLKGHVKNEYNFNPKSEIDKNDFHFRKNPSVKHQTHCVVFVLDSTTVDEKVLGPYIEKIKKFQDGTKDLDIPCILILTKIDKLCPEVHADVTKTFRSIKVHKAVKSAAEIFGIPEGNVHPIKNYEVEIELRDNESRLILLALRQLLYYSFDKIENLKGDSTSKCSVS